MKNVIVPKLEYAGVWERNAKLVKQLETVQTTAAKNMPSLGCSSTTCSTVFIPGIRELGMYPLKTNRGVRNVK